MGLECENSDLMEQLAAILEDLNKKFSEIDSPVLIALKVGKDSYSTLALGKKEHDPMLDLASKLLSGDTDLFIRSLILHAKKNGHTSLLLKAMGIPERKEL